MRWRLPLQLLAGSASVIALAHFGGPLVERLSRREPPPGWNILRPPGETSAVALAGPLVWTGGAGGLVVFERHPVRKASLKLPRTRHVRDILVDRQGQIWVAESAGLWRYAAGEWRSWTAPGALLALGETPDGALWMGGESGLWRWEDGEPRLVASRERVGLDAIETLYADGAALWLGSMSPKGGLVRFDGASFEPRTQGLAHPAVSAILRDSSGILWFGTGFGRAGGACGLKNGAWRVLTKAEGLAGEKARSIFEDRNGRLWIGSEYDGIAVLEGGRRRLLTPEQGLSGWEVKEMVQDDDGVFWLGTENGVTRIEAL